MRIIVSDTSCLIDLRKVDLLGAFMSLPYEVMIPNALFEDELLKFTDDQKQMLLDAGLQVIDLPGQAVLRAQQVIGIQPRLSANDAFAFVLAESTENSILLTGDGALRSMAENHVEVHGVLWLVDEMYRHQVATAEVLHAVLEQFSADPTVRLPTRDLGAFIKRYAALR